MCVCVCEKFIFRAELMKFDGNGKSETIKICKFSRK